MASKKKATFFSITSFLSDQVDSNMSLPKFCFPDADEFRPGSMTTTRYAPWLCPKLSSVPGFADVSFLLLK